jgi:hypothetical protein
MSIIEDDTNLDEELGNALTDRKLVCDAREIEGNKGSSVNV